MSFVGSSGNMTVDAMGQINISGNVIPMEWYKTILRDNGKPHLLAITILSDIVYWYRPSEIRDEHTGMVVGWKKKFKNDYLQRNYSEYENMFGESKRSVKAAIDLLVELGVVNRYFKNGISTADGFVEESELKKDEHNYSGAILYNVMFLELNVNKLYVLTFPQKEENTSDHADSDTLVQNNVGGGTKFCRGSYKKMQEGVQSFVGGGTTNCNTLVQNDVIGPTKFCGTNTKNTTENTYTEITTENTTKDLYSNNFISNPILSGTRDETRWDRTTENGDKLPTIVLDFSKSMDEEDLWNMEGVLEEKDGIPYQYARQPETMTMALKVLAGWNDRIYCAGNYSDEENAIYVCMLKNLIEMATTLQPFTIGGRRTVTYANVIDQINGIYHAAKINKSSALSLLLDRCIERYKDAYAKTKIVKVDAYCKAVIWSTFDSYQVDWDGFFYRTENQAQEEKVFLEQQKHQTQMSELERKLLEQQ